MASLSRRANGRWQARWYDPSGRQRAKDFARKVDAQRHLDQMSAAMVRGDYVDPHLARMTVGQWCDLWLESYASHRPSTVKQARVHLRLIREAFGSTPLAAVKPSDVKLFTARLSQRGLADSYVYAVYRRLAQIFGDAVHDGLLARNPCSRRTAPRSGAQRPYVATTEQVWDLHDAVPEHLRPAILLGAFAGLRTAEVCGLRPADVDFMRGLIVPAQQHGGLPLKSAASATTIPIPRALTLRLSEAVARGNGEAVVSDALGRPLPPWAISRAVQRTRAEVVGLPQGFRFHDLRHYYASMLIAEGLDVKIVQSRLRHASVATTLGTYGHLWPDADESSRAAVERVMAAREDKSRTSNSSA